MNSMRNRTKKLRNWCLLCVCLTNRSEKQRISSVNSEQTCVNIEETVTNLLTDSEKWNGIVREEKHTDEYWRRIEKKAESEWISSHWIDSHTSNMVPTTDYYSITAIGVNSIVQFVYYFHSNCLIWRAHTSKRRSMSPVIFVRIITIRSPLTEWVTKQKLAQLKFQMIHSSPWLHMSWKANYLYTHLFGGCLVAPATKN